jgi:kojibiose phosphorylase
MTDTDLICTSFPRDPNRQVWIETAAPALEGRLATQYSLANGTLGLRGTHEEMPGWASPGFYLAGTYCPAPGALIPIHSPDHILTHPERVKPEHHADYTHLTTMPNLPNPVAVRLTVGDERIDLEHVSILACERILHLQFARVSRRLVVRDGAGRKTIIDSERFVSWANRNLVCFRYVVTPDGHDAPIDVTPFINTHVANARGLRLFTVTENQETSGFNQVTVTIPGHETPIAIVQAYAMRREGASTVLDVCIACRQGDDPTAIAQSAISAGYNAQRDAHHAAVKEDLSRTQADITADGMSVQGLNFAQLHLEMALPYDNPDVSVPIKGLTGEGYRFMVFWDTDFHLFPYYLLTNPAQARNLLVYRHRQLDAYRRFAASWGYPGAQVPWETGLTGEEETAPWLCLPEREIHISADVAYAVKLYDEWSGDPSLLLDYGAEIVYETARFYAARVTWNAERDHYEIRDIGCPDQYHTFADNNVFISRMAKFNLAYAAELAADPRLRAVRAKIGLTDAEAVNFRIVAEKLYVIPPNAEGIIEECDGFFDLSTDLRGISETFCSHSQAVKQPDVLLLFGPFGDEYSEEIQQRNWHFYAARTLHGSSLSLPGMALAAAKCGLLREAVDYFQRSVRMDLDDVNLNTNLGVHLAGYAVAWETVVFGFGGLTPRRDGLHITPRLPQEWRCMRYHVTWHGCRVEVYLAANLLLITADAGNSRSVPVTVNGESREIAAGEKVQFSQ